MDESALESPNVLVLEGVIPTEFSSGIAHHVLGQLLMEGTSDVDVLTGSISEMTAYRLPEALGDVFTWTMEQIGVEENDITLLHG